MSRQTTRKEVARPRADHATEVALPIAGAALLGFALIAAWTATGGAERFDEAVMLALRDRANPADPLGPPWVAAAMRDITALGGNAVLALVTAVVAAHLWLVRGPAAAVLPVLAVAGGALLAFALKLGFDRPRPDLVPHAIQVASASFPSMHALLAAVAYPTLGAVVAEAEPGVRRAARLFPFAAGALLAVLVGLSRVYLGVHWPSDVLAGWCAGVAWAALCWLAVRRLRKAGGLARPDDGHGQPVSGR